MSNNVVKEPATTAFGEASVESITPVTQISAQYGLLSGVLTVLDSAASGSATTANEKFICETGTAVNGLSSITTLKQLAYRTGQGAMARLTAIFDNPRPQNVQAAGLITSQNSFVFGYQGEDFGIIHSFGGEDELQELTITSPALGAEVATVTINSIAYPVNLTAGTIQQNAYEIALQLNGTVPNYQFSSNNDQVVAQSVLPGPQGAFLYSSATSAGSWSQIVSGVSATRNFTAQSEWNGDTKPDLNPQAGNVYQIQFQYLGFGDIKFYIEDSETGDFVLVHTIMYANNNTVPSVTNPTFRIGWLVFNEGNTTNVKIQGASAAGFIQGKLVLDSQPIAEFKDQLAIGASLTNVVTLRNRNSFGGKVNRANLYPLIVSASSQTTKSAFFLVVINPIFSTPVVFQYKNKDGSIAEITTDKAVISGGDIIGGVTVTNNDSKIVEFNERDNIQTTIPPGSTVCIAAQMSGGSASDCQAIITWLEDI